MQQPLPICGVSINVFLISPEFSVYFDTYLQLKKIPSATLETIVATLNVKSCGSNPVMYANPEAHIYYYSDIPYTT